jgi:nucleoside-diphosphate-sugar epimerase
MPFETLAQTQMAPSLILHFAFLTRGHAAAMKLADYVEANRAITHSLVALMERDGALGLFMPSSGAVYGAHGGLDEDLSGNPYGVLKRQDEERFMTLGENLGCPVAVIRIFNLAGPYINNPNGYALASILTEIGQGGPIRLRARQPVWRSYTHVADMLNVGLAVLLAKAATPPFDTAGDEVIEIADLARRAATLCGAPSIPILRPELDLQISDRYAGDGGLYRALAADFGLTLQQLDANIVDTYSYITGQVRHPRSLRVQ